MSKHVTIDTIDSDLSTTRNKLDKEIIVKDASDLSGTLQSDVVYFLDGIIDLTGEGFSIEVPAGGLYFSGHNFDISGLVCSDDNYTLITSAVGGSGNILGDNFFIKVDGVGSQVYALSDSDGTHAIEYYRVNFMNCSSLGYIDGYRQYLEDGTGRFGGDPVLEFRGAWNGARITTSIRRGGPISTSLFKAGVGLLFSGSFFTDINVDIPTSGALVDFSPSNFSNPETLNLNGVRASRSFVFDASDTTLTPNIKDTDNESLRANNVGLPSTIKQIKGVVTAEQVTTISAANTYYPLEGTFTIESASHFSSPANGQYRLDSGNGDYTVSGDLPISGTANDEISVRVSKSTDGGLTFPTEVNHIRRTINNLSGGRDVAFVSISFLLRGLNQGDIVRLEVENYSGARDVTAELDSFLELSAK